MQFSRIDKSAVRISSIKEEDKTDWKDKSYTERIAAIEFLRFQHHGSSPRLQRVYRITKRV